MSLRIDQHGYRLAHPALCLLLIAQLLGLSGCVLTGRDGTRHYIVVGVGVVSVPPADAPSSVTAAKVQALGVVVSPAPAARVAVGYVNTHQVAVAADTESVVEMSQRVGGPIKISVSTHDEQEHEP